MYRVQQEPTTGTILKQSAQEVQGEHLLQRRIQCRETEMSALHGHAGVRAAMRSLWGVQEPGGIQQKCKVKGSR